MKVIILLAGYGKRLRPHTWSRPKPLLKTAGNTVVGHILDLMSDITTDEVIFVVGYRGDQIEDWIREYYPDLNARFVVQEEPLGQAHAVWLCRDYIDGGDVVVAFGDGIIEADYAGLPNPDVDGVFLVQEIEDPRRFGVVKLDDDGYVTSFIEKPPTKEHKLVVAGINWFRDGRQLSQAIDKVIREERKTLGEFFMADAYSLMIEEGARLRTKELKHWVDAGTREAILKANAHLLSVGHGSEEAQERGRADGFSVIHPVYLHPTADVKSAVIGPYATIDAGVQIRNAVVRNSIIDAGAVVADCVLENALIGENAKVSGRGRTMFVGDDSTVEIG
jgi:glucose-1-phosphate thymidylyltransferase